MRPVLHGDVVAAARALLLVAQDQRVDLCLQLFQQADFADRYRKRFGRPHPDWGTGSLMSAALARPVADEPPFRNGNYCRCLEMVLHQLVVRQKA